MKFQLQILWTLSVASSHLTRRFLCHLQEAFEGKDYSGMNYIYCVSFDHNADVQDTFIVSISRL